MKLKSKPLLSIASFLMLTIPLIFILNAEASQIYHGDGATPVMTTPLGWTTGAAGSDQCLHCHNSLGGASDKSSYLKTGHKNMLRKVSPGLPWAGADGIPYGTGDPGAYGQPVFFNWTAGTVSGTDSPPSIPAGSLIYYVFGGYEDLTQMNTIFNGGFTGEVSGDYGVAFPQGNYDCGRCHTTGYQFDKLAPEPTYGGAPISDLNFSRIPGIFADSTTTPGTIVCTDPSGTCSSSWHLDGIQCERCHNADNGTYNHTTSGEIAGGIPTKPIFENATALCIECHRQESADTASNTITLSTDLAVSDGGSCSDGVSPDYATCVAIPVNTWNYAPFFDASIGQAFLNSSHARFTGNLAQTAQNSPDLSVSMTGTYNSAFQDPSTGKNLGCDGCHDVHKSVVEAVGQVGIVKDCTVCHAGLPLGFHNGIDSPDAPKNCQTCHIPQGYHLFRINIDPNYSTFPTAAQLYAGQTTANAASDGRLAGAVWVDLDLACGQCHGGNGPSYITIAKNIASLISAGYHSASTASVTWYREACYSATFDASMNNALTYSWDFGDGTTGSGAIVTHEYQAPGSYLVKLSLDSAPTKFMVITITTWPWLSSLCSSSAP